MTLQEALDFVSVHHADEIPDWKGSPEWFGVSTDSDGGIIAYFAKETDAFAFRMAIINRLLNPDASI
jgi:hypothetical protein